MYDPAEDTNRPGPVRDVRERMDQAVRDYLEATKLPGVATHWVLVFSRSTTDDDGDIAEAIGSVYSHPMPEWQVMGLLTAQQEYGRAQYRRLTGEDT